MTFVTISKKSVLRADPHYFNSYTAFNAHTFKSVHLSSQQYKILQRIKSFPTLFEKLKQDFKTDNNPQLFQTLIDEGILIIGEKLSYPTKLKSINYDKPFNTSVPLTSSPAQIELCITRRCNQSCFHCNISAYSEKIPEKLNIDFWKQFIDQCVEQRVLKLTVTGGEPFIRKGWDEFYEYLANAPIAVTILTNATKIRDDHMEIMARAGHTLSISLDGINSEQHDNFRRTPGSFNKTMKTMYRLNEYEIPFTVNTVIHSENFNDVEKVYDIGKKVGARVVVLCPMAAVGRGSSKASQKYFPTNGAIQMALEKMRIRGLNESGPELTLATNIEEREMLDINKTFSGVTQMSKRTPAFCKAGIYAMAVDQDGLAYSCLRGLQTRIHPIGDLKLQSLQEVWSGKMWSPFRDPSLPKVPCRVENIESNPKNYQSNYSDKKQKSCSVCN